MVMNFKNNSPLWKITDEIEIFDAKLQKYEYNYL